MLIRLIVVFLFTFSFSAQNNITFYNVNFQEELNLLSIYAEIQNNNLSAQLNDQYYINVEFLYDLGITPFSTLYMIDKEIDYSISYNIISSYYINDIYIELDEYLINNNFSFSETMNMRGVDLAQISYFPIEYDTQNHSLRIIEEVEITILEEESVYQEEESHIVPISEEFEILLNSMVINLDISSRTTDELGSILYICGGNYASNSYFQDLVQWRKEQGYIVYIVNTSETGTSQSSIKNYIEDAYYTWEYPPEFIVLVGDTAEIGYSSASGGESDYPYTLIDGNDLLPEMFIGRFPVNSSSDLNNMINKTLVYEQATFIEYTGTDWYESSALVGDPSATGNSAIITNEYIENILNAFDFNDVETCYGCSYSSWMQNRLEEGILYFNYRGYIGTSGFSSSHINNANNGYMTPFVTFITCSTGGFASSWGDSIIESFVHAGSTSNPKGAVAAIGTATSSTHTVPNNILDMGIYDGILSKNLKTAGAALVNGKLSLYNTYPENPNQMVYKFTHWNNLMGDPVLHLWKDTPKGMFVEYPEIVNMGTDLISVNVSDEYDLPIPDARVVIYKDDEAFYSYTNENGDAFVDCESYINFSAKITVLKDGYIPFSNSISVTNQQLHIELDDDLMFYVDDSDPSNSNPSNGLPNPGEIVDIYFYIDNLSLNNIESLDGYVSTNSIKIDIIDGYFEIDNLLPFIPTIIGPAELYIHEDLVATDLTDLTLTIMDESDGISDWNLSVPFEIMSPNIILENSSLDNANLHPGGTVNLDMTFGNFGTDVLYDSYVNVSINSSLIDIPQPGSSLGDISLSQSVNTETPIIINIDEDIIDGSVFNLNVNIYNNDGYSQDMNLNLTVGTANEQDPLGPDSYGYYIYDWTDIGYSLTPFYEWIELDPNQGGEGIDLGISDSGNGNGITNSTKYIDIPFTFTFYGEDYDEISVNANGWISFGHSNMESFRNYQLPGAGGPSPMIAAFWDDLKTNSNSKVLKYIGEDYIIIEWMEMRTYQHNDVETFQIILYNSITPTGDDEIKIQYKEINNTTNGDYSQYTPYHGCYSTIGIENHQATVGLEYTFDNKYPNAATHLEDQSALFITTKNTTVLTSGDVNQDNEVNILDIVMVINHILVIEELDSIGEFVADMDNNGLINILDVILMINLILD